MRKKKKTEEPYQQQGDVLIKPITDFHDKNELPENVRLKAVKNVVLAEGEVTGHAHRIEQDNCYLYEDEDGNLFLEVKDKPCNLTHEEHKPQDIRPGLWWIDGVVERDHLAKIEKTRRVID